MVIVRVQHSLHSLHSDIPIMLDLPPPTPRPPAAASPANWPRRRRLKTKSSARPKSQMFSATFLRNGNEIDNITLQFAFKGFIMKVLIQNILLGQTVSYPSEQKDLRNIQDNEGSDTEHPTRTNSFLSR